MSPTVYQDLNSVVQFILNTLSSLGSLVLSSILIFGLTLWVLSFVVKLFKRFLR